MKKGLIIIIVWHFLISILGLLSCDCGPFPDKFKTTAFDWSLYEIEFSENSENNFTRMYSEADTFDYRSFSVMAVPLKQAYYSMVNKLPPFSFNSLYACSPVDPVTDEKIDSIAITCNNDFGPDYPKGSNLAALFDVMAYDFVNDINNEKFAANTYSNTHPYIPDELTFLLNTFASKDGFFEFTFRIYIKGEDPEYFEFTTGEVYLMN